MSVEHRLVEGSSIAGFAAVCTMETGKVEDMNKDVDHYTIAPFNPIAEEVLEKAEAHNALYPDHTIIVYTYSTAPKPLE
jgi:hypothetical protein